MIVVLVGNAAVLVFDGPFLVNCWLVAAACCPLGAAGASGCYLSSRNSGSLHALFTAVRKKVGFKNSSSPFFVPCFFSSNFIILLNKPIYSNIVS